jgi:flavodoxin
MKILVVYYSRDGHTRSIAKEMSAAISADLYEITEPQSRAGVMGYLSAAKDAALKKATAIDETAIDSASYDYVLVGTPIWAFTMPSAVRTWLTKYGKALKNPIFFATMGGNGDQRTFAQMEELCSTKPLLTATFIDKEIDKGAYGQKLDTFIGKVKEQLGPAT